MRMLLACIVGALSGYIALSYEILWVRVYNFATEGRPESFGLLLAAYLAGLAAGSLFAGRLCDRAGAGQPKHCFWAGAFFVIANIAAFLAIPLSALLLGDWGKSPAWMLPVFGVAAAFLGVSFPLISHFAIPSDQRAGARLSYVYVSNIFGSTLGSLVTGLWLLDVLSLPQLSVMLALSGAGIGALLMIIETAKTRGRWIIAGGLGVVAAGIVGTAPPLYFDLYERLLYKADYLPGESFPITIEGRSGVVSMTKSGAVYGSGSYDGQLNTSPLPHLDDNRVVRAYLLPAFHPRPREILIIGLGAGSWLQVLANCPEIEHITVIEINPGFVTIARQDPHVASAITNPKVEILIDDGRRYLTRTTKHFDVMVQNTIVFWRGHASTLLSREYLELSRRHLKEGGFVYFNTTMSTAAQKTGATVFPHALRFQNMLIVGEQAITIDRARFERLLNAWQIDGQAVLPPNLQAADLDLLTEQKWRGGSTWEDGTSILARTRNTPLITDDNMASEFGSLETYP